MDERVPPALAATGVSKTFPGQKALDDVSLEVGAGEVHALLGENGSGKSTLIKILAGAYVPDPGADVFVNGEQLPLGSPAASFERGLRFVHQKLGVVQEMNAVENIALEAGFTRAGFIDWKAQERLTRRLLERFDVDIDVWKPLRESRAVERSLVAIARALRPSNPDGRLHSGEVPLVVLDEPTSSLPAAEVESLFGIVRDLAAAGIAVIYVSHRLDEVFEIADRVSVLRDGRRTATSDVASLSRGELVQLIVGREIKTSWSRPVRAAPRGDERAALQVLGLQTGRISGVSFDVGRGEVLGVAGVTGSGRELLARAVAGAVLPDSGSITVAGERLRDVTPREALRAGVVLALGNTQPHSAIVRFSTAENLTLCSLPRYSATGRLHRRRERCDAAEWMKQLDVRPPDPERLYDLLSGGNQQKVILGKSLMAAPKVLVLDEPTAGVDVGARQAIYRLIAEQADAGLGVLLCSSDAEDIVTLSDRAIVMRDGRVVAELAREDISEHNLLLEAVGDAGA